MPLRDQIETTPGSGVWVDVVRFANTTPSGDPNDPIVSAIPNLSGEAIADEYQLSFSSVDAIGHTAVVHVTTQAADNPYRTEGNPDRSPFAIAIDGATVLKNVVPGVSLVLSGSGSFVDTWEGTVYVGKFMGTFPTAGAGAGDPSVGVRHKVTNDESGAVAESKVVLREMAKLVRTGGTGIFEYTKPFANGASEKIAGGGSQMIVPYEVTVANVSGSGSGKTMDVLFDGATVTVRDLDSGLEFASEDLSVTKVYKVASGNLTGLTFKLLQTAIVSDTANILIFPPRYTQIAEEVAPNTAGDYGIDDIVLTQVGQAPGIIQPGGAAYYWQRILAPEGASSESNPYPAEPSLEGLLTGSAQWF